MAPTKTPVSFSPFLILDNGITVTYPLLIVPSLYRHNGAVTSTARSTTARTRSANTRWAHSISRSSSQTLASILSTLTRTPGTAMPAACSRSSSRRARSCRFSSTAVVLFSPLASSDSVPPVSCLAPSPPSSSSGRRGSAIGDTLSAPNCASRNMQRRLNCSSGVM